MKKSLIALAAVALTACSQAPEKTVRVYAWQGESENTTEQTLQADFSKWHAHGVDGMCYNAGHDTEKIQRAARVAHANGMEYHAWIPAMLQQGLDSVAYAVNREGESAYRVQAYVPYYTCLCPNQEATANFLLDLYGRVAEIPEVDYIHLDYIRYVDVILARGLFLDSETGEVVARSYEKFFRRGETESTSLESLGRSLSFPLDAYVKENGYLGILSYIPSKDSLFAASKSTDVGPFADRFRELLRPYEERLKEHFRKTWKDFPHSLVFEVIDVENDPHIIEYEKSGVVLLDCIANSFDFRKLPYDELKGIASEVGVAVKRHAFTVNNRAHLSRLVKECSVYNNRFVGGSMVEGFVLEDRKGFMVKQKTKYYDEWKKLRSVADKALRCGVFPKPSAGSPSNPLGIFEEMFCAFLARIRGSYYDEETKSYPFPVDIISLRKRLFAGE